MTEITKTVELHPVPTNVSVSFGYLLFDLESITQCVIVSLFFFLSFDCVPQPDVLHLSHLVNQLLVYLQYRPLFCPLVAGSFDL